MQLESYMESLRRGDISALEFIYYETKNAVFSIAFGILKDYYLAEDIMQDTFIKVKNYIDKYKKGTNARQWIFTIAKNTSLNLYNRRKREIYSLENTGKADYSIPKGADESGVYQTILRTLNGEESKIVIMHILGGFKLSEIADMLSASRGTVRWQYGNALKKLRKLNEDDFV